MIGGLVSAILELNETNYSSSLFNLNNGWKYFKTEHSQLLSIVIDKLLYFPNEKISFRYDVGNYTIIQLPFAEIVAMQFTNDRNIEYRFMFRFNEITEDILLEKIGELINSKITNQFSIKKINNSILLVEESNNFPKDINVDCYIETLKKANDLKLNRSWLLLGQAGTGKTSTAKAILSKLNYKTLKIRYADFQNIDINFAKLLIHLLNIEAIIIDDFDQVPETNYLLELLEVFNANCKLTIAIANSTKDLHPAIIRPDRFDEIIVINSIERQVVKDILGNLSDQFFERVKHFPIAYIIELVDRSKLYSIEQIEHHFNDLNNRVGRQLEKLKQQ